MKGEILYDFSSVMELKVTEAEAEISRARDSMSTNVLHLAILLGTAALVK